jgi:hypothetical protein
MKLVSRFEAASAARQNCMAVWPRRSTPLRVLRAAAWSAATRWLRLRNIEDELAAAVQVSNCLAAGRSASRFLANRP